MVNLFRRFSRSKSTEDTSEADKKEEPKTKSKKNPKGNPNVKSGSRKKKPAGRKLPPVATNGLYRPVINPVTLHKLLQKNCKEEVDPSASLYLEGVLVYTAVEILELSFNRAREMTGRNDCTLTAEDMKAAIEGDEELSYLIRVSEKKTAPAAAAEAAATTADAPPEEPPLPAPSVTDFLETIGSSDQLPDPPAAD